MTQAAERRSSWTKGCLIVGGVVGLVALVCGGVVTLLGWQVWSSPTVQRGVQIAGAAMDLTREAQRAPGAAELRQVGCAQGLVYSPELLERFVDTIRGDAGTPRGAMPTHPLVMCQVRGRATPSCADVARTYFGAVDTPHREAGVTVQHRGRAICQGVYDADGTRLREADVQQRRIGNMGRTGG
ncbi:MAG TPA: hypothetical protein RMH99_09675 [Sandaracinaceae bacterium LLY-WYZ-13_1]|nr:hypothetical protein [Sandaracinaceae bacterium LLY-WYZ-13_1]